MYGKLRIVITKENRIILAGNKSWINIGIVKELINGVEARFVLPQNRFVRTMDDTNSLTYGGINKKEVRRVIGKLYGIGLKKKEIEK